MVCPKISGRTPALVLPAAQPHKPHLSHILAQAPCDAESKPNNSWWGKLQPALVTDCYVVAVFHLLTYHLQYTKHYAGHSKVAGKYRAVATASQSGKEGQSDRPIITIQASVGVLPVRL